MEPPKAGSIEEMTERLMLWAQQELGAIEVRRGCEEFFAAAGKFFPDDSFYHARTGYFFDYFLFVRPYADRNENGKARPPFERFLEQARAGSLGMMPEDVAAFADLASFRHSIFQVRRVTDKELLVRDLVTGEKHRIRPEGDELFLGFRKKEIFQGFVFPDDKEAVLSRGVLLHPISVHRIIKRFIRRQLKSDNFDENALLFELAKEQLRFLRHRHVDPKRLYANDLG